MMHRYCMTKYFFALSAGLLTMLVLAADAGAVDIERSSQVSSVRIEPLGEFFERIDDGQVALVGREECVNLFENNSPISFYFNFGSGTGTFHSARVFATPTQVTPEDFRCDLEERTSCTDVENVDEFRDPNTGVEATYGETIDFADLVSEAVEGQHFVSDEQPNNGIALLQNADDCREVPVDQQYFIRLLFNTGTQSRGDIFDAVLELDTEPPATPDEITSVMVTEASITAEWEQENTDDLNLDLEQEIGERHVQPFVVYYSTRNITGSTQAELEDASDVQRETLSRNDGTSRGPSFSGEASLRNLDLDDEDTRVWVAIAARDEVGNIGEPIYPEGDAAEEGFVPVPVVDFWENYREAGGRETGGCNTSSGAPVEPSSLLLIALGLGWLGFRRRRHFKRVLPVAAAAVAFGAVATSPGEAAAQSSPTWGMIEIRVGGYYPSIDDEEGLSGTPFEDVFGESSRLLFEYEQGVHIFDGFGALGASASLGYTHFGGDILVEEGMGVDAEDVNESTGLMVVPARVGLYYRVDQFEKFWNIPIVPVVKAGLDYVLWQAEDPSGSASVDGDVEGEGATAGWHASAALHLQLDWIDPSSAALFDYDWGINHSYAFAEYMHTEVDDFGSSDSFILSDDQWMFGLAFEY